MYAFTVPSGLVGAVSRHTCCGCAAAAFRLAARADVAGAGSTPGGRVTPWSPNDKGSRTMHIHALVIVTRSSPQLFAEQHRGQAWDAVPDEWRYTHHG